MDLSAQIESFLMERRDWVSVRELCTHFQIRERSLRQLGNRPGLCSRFAISHPRLGIKHVACASTAEYIHAKHAMTRHAISELRRKSAWERCRSNQAIAPIKKPLVTVERDSGQILWSDIIGQSVLPNH